MNFWYPLNGAQRDESEKIDKLIPLYPVKIMKLGDWFHVPAGPHMPKAVKSTCYGIAHRLGFKLRFEIVDCGVKVTRVG